MLLFTLLLSLTIPTTTIAIPQSSSLIASPIPSLTPSLTPSPTCRCHPHLPCWPSPSEWTLLNATLNGKLISTTPLASICHTTPNHPPYNASACQTLRADWPLPKTHYTSPSSPMAPWFNTETCNPFLPPDAPCTLGALPAYVVNATCADDYIQTINFARTHNLRLVIRNTGHDYLGKSTGSGALALWTHHLKDMRVIRNYTSKVDLYTGPAIQFGAGIQVHEALTFAHHASPTPFTLVAGNCQSVGLAGGYTQGGGHGQLASMYGLAADQVLEWEVVTASGTLLTASRTENEDLYWALCGGGGGVFGAVVSMTSKVYPDGGVVTANLTFRADGGVPGEVFWGVVERLVSGFAAVGDVGGAAIWMLQGGEFGVTPVTVPGSWGQWNVTYSYHISPFPTFYSSYTTMNPLSNVTESQIGGRLIPRSTVNSKMRDLMRAFKQIAGYGAAISGVSLNVSRHAIPDNAVNPAWRESAIDIVLGLPYNFTNRALDAANQQLMTDVLLPFLEAITPDSGAYLNEADIHQPDWQGVFYGESYERLLAVKRKWDPEGLFYAKTGVGSEWWEEREGGRLCWVGMVGI
ncbi:FAD binding domain protein [Aspergillus heteromorphus CBS 117.55]|uniref:FAD binding domain protein n=1 Tax=Aspergillus heteromorphus CBS 117.55 TaxID=1448321 RepID=A0A317WEZ4_9EURO|nr:FAD binding domain protein [Aspergillus heteromorphus CBS 117.55]PWY84973.1 FAD binding domain protein [Aspergillus heteromorphus CBS 117.55]